MSRFKDFFGNAQTIVLVLVVVIGGLWYLYSNKFFPFDNLGRARADVSHDIYSACLDGEHRWLRAIVDIRNVGAARFKLSNSDHYVSQIAPLRDYPLPEVAPTGAIRSPLLAHSPPDTDDILSEPHRHHTRSDEFSIRPSVKLILEPGEVHRQYQDFVIPPAVRFVEVTSTFLNTSRSTKEKIASWEAKTIYDVGSASCPQ